MAQFSMSKLEISLHVHLAEINQRIADYTFFNKHLDYETKVIANMVEIEKSRYSKVYRLSQELMKAQKFLAHESSKTHSLEKKHEEMRQNLLRLNPSLRSTSKFNTALKATSVKQYFDITK